MFSIRIWDRGALLLAALDASRSLIGDLRLFMEMVDVQMGEYPNRTLHEIMILDFDREMLLLGLEGCNMLAIDICLISLGLHIERPRVVYNDVMSHVINI